MTKTISDVENRIEAQIAVAQEALDLLDDLGYAGKQIVGAGFKILFLLSQS